MPTRLWILEDFIRVDCDRNQIRLTRPRAFFVRFKQQTKRMQLIVSMPPTFSSFCTQAVSGSKAYDKTVMKIPREKITPIPRSEKFNVPCVSCTI
jgi:hypothetical protein